MRAYPHVTGELPVSEVRARVAVNRIASVRVTCAKAARSHARACSDRRCGGLAAATHRGVGLGVSGSAVVSTTDSHADWLVGPSAAWTRTYLRRVSAADFIVAAVAAAAAVGLRFGANPSPKYVVLSLSLPALWMIAVRVAGGYEMRFLGTGSDEFRRVLNAGVSLTAAFALISYAVNNELSREYLVISMPAVIILDLSVRLVLRKRLHRLRSAGRCMSTVVAVGHAAAVEQLINELRRESHHGLNVVAACLVGSTTVHEVAGVPVFGGLDATADVVRHIGAGHGGGAVLPRDRRGHAEVAGVGAGEDGHRSMRRARPARRGRAAHDDQADGRADPAARGSPAAVRPPPGAQGALRPGHGRGWRW